ncbi:MAG TPA: alpha/beta hydrolase [Gemmatimonadaceae bacterium]|nr:alpha/beta hydrolase [Gemmatimonadaceae bacterium]
MVSIARHRLMISVAIAGGTVFGLLVLFLSGVWLLQEKIAFQPERGPYPLDAGIPRVEYVASDGQKLFAYIVRNAESSGGLLIAFHGNADLAIRQVEWATEVTTRTGVAVMLPEYRGYMGLPGKPTYEGSRHDAEAAYRYAIDSLRFSPARIAFFGHSLGTAIAAELAERHEPAALILQSPFTSAREMFAIVIGHTPAEFTWNTVARLHFDTRAKVASLDAPVSVAHGDTDRIIPSRMGQSVFDAARVTGEWLLVPGASHNDVEQRGGERYWRWLVSALAPLSATRSGETR